MIKYSTNDIIKRAEQLADLENSDFISDYEKLALLNESWQMIYQKLINVGDKSFIKKITIANGDQLPTDLFQISSIYTSKNKDAITKMNSVQMQGYDIYNNTLVVSNGYANQELTMEYYPIPKTLFLKDKIQDSPYPERMTAAYKTMYVTDDYTIYSLEDSGTDFQIPVDEVIPGASDSVFTGFEMFKNAALVHLNENTIVTNLVNGETFALDKDDVVPLVRDNVLYLYSTELKQVLDLGLNVYVEDYKPLEKIESEDKPESIYVTDDFANAYVIYDKAYFYNGRGYEIPEIKHRLMYSQNGLYAVTTQGVLLMLTEFGSVLIPNEKIVERFTSDTKMLVRSGLSTTYYLDGIQSETELSYPNNLYFVLLAYLLAMSFKAKQGSDVSVLQAQYNTSEAQLFDSIDRDNNSQYTIKNVYKQRWM